MSKRLPIFFSVLLGLGVFVFLFVAPAPSFARIAECDVSGACVADNCCDPGCSSDPDCSVGSVCKTGSCGPQPSNYCCTQSGGCSGTPCGNVSQWTWCYDPQCQLVIPSICEWRWVSQQCGAVDSCRGGVTLKAGLCSSSGCAVGGDYKTCCQGTTPVDCTGGDFRGYCPSGSVAKFCGFGGYPPCGAAACAAEGGEEEPPPPPPGSGECPGNTTFNNCSWCTRWNQCADSGAPKWWTISGEGYCSSPEDIRCCLCTWNVGGGPPPPPPPSCTVNLTPDSTSIVAGTTTPFVASVSPSNGTVDRVDFLSSNNLVVTVSPTSDSSSPYSTTATGVSAGSTTVTTSVIMSGSPRCSDSSNITVIAPGPWWQVRDADIQANGDLTSSIPAQCTSPDCDPTFDLDGTGGYPGVPAYADTSASFGSGSVSSTGWLANSAYAGGRYDYAYFSRLSPPKAEMTKIEDSDLDPDGALSGGYFVSNSAVDKVNWFYREGDLALKGTANMNVKRAVVLVEGNLNLGTGGRNVNLRVKDGVGFLGFFVQGNIAVSPQTRADDPDEPWALEALLMADGSISTGTFASTADYQLTSRGSWVAWGGISLQRDLDPGGTTGVNIDTPAELFEYAPDLLFTFPRELARRGVVWREIAP